MTKEQFRSIYDIAVKEYYNDFVADVKTDVSMSSDFEKRMTKLILQQKKPYWDYVNTAGKRVAIIAAVLLALSFGSLTVKSVRDSVIEKIKKVYEIFISYQYKGNNDGVISTYYRPTYIPEGLVEKDLLLSDISYTVIYNDEYGKLFKFVQLLPSDVEFFYDNEHSQEINLIIENVIVEGIRSKDFISVHWEKDNYVFQISSDCGFTDEEIIKIIKSVKPMQ